MELWRNGLHADRWKIAHEGGLRGKTAEQNSDAQKNNSAFTQGGEINCTSPE